MSSVCFFHALDVAEKNEEELRLLPGPSVVFEAVDGVEDAPYLTLVRTSALLDGALKYPVLSLCESAPWWRCPPPALRHEVCPAGRVG